MIKSLLKPHQSLVRTYIKQRKINLKKWRKNPWEELEKYKANAQNIPSIIKGEVKAPWTQVTIVDRLAEETKEEYEEALKKGEVPGTEILEEEPGIQEYIDWVKLTTVKPGGYYPQARRCGAIAIKIGMFPQWTEYFERIVVTGLWIPNCQVLQQKTLEKDGYTALQLGAGTRKVKNTQKAMLGHFEKAGTEPKQVLAEFKVTKDCMLPVGHEITARHFRAGQYIDIVSWSKGKGFQGGMKRHNFAGLRATHGVSVSHRSQGSSGPSGQRMWKGKKMAGHMGNRRVRKLNNWVFMVDYYKNVIFVKGNVPGSNGSYCLIEDALVKRGHLETIANPPPFPAFFPPKDEDVTKMNPKDCIIKARGMKPEFWDGYGDKQDAITSSPEQILAMVKEAKRKAEIEGHIGSRNKK